MIKYKLYVLFLLFILILSLSSVSSKNFPLLGKIIFIDPGHGGIDCGATYHNYKESVINLEISNVLKTELEKKGAIVYLTRDGDYDNSSPKVNRRKKSDFDNRIKLIKSIKKVSLVVSIHLNAEPTGLWHGIQVFYSKDENFANIITKDLKTKRTPKKINSIYLLDNLDVPTVLIECGFLSNYSEFKNLINNEYQKKLAKNITSGIVKYIQ
ncbi:MAG: N-acetylmuramoyl-L-alanine amidase [Bacilli bacterium]